MAYRNYTDELAKFDSNGFVYVDATQVVSFLYNFSFITRARCRSYMKKACNDLENYMKANRPWKDRTGNAKANLRAKFIDSTLEGKNWELKIELQHGVPYGVFLEFNGVHNRMYLSRQRPILIPTLKLEVPKIIRGMKSILKKLAL